MADHTPNWMDWSYLRRGRGRTRGETKRARCRVNSRRWLRIERLEDRHLLAPATDLALISGRVFQDLSGNGFTAGEEVVGATINLYRDNGNNSFDAGSDTLVRAVTTDASGHYRLDGLTAGTYFVQQPAQTAGGKTIPLAVSPAIPISATDVQGRLLRTIDSFDQTFQSVSDSTNDGTPVTSSVAAAEAIGGERDILVNKTSVNGRVQISINDPLLLGLLTFDSILTGSGDRVVSWDGVDGNAQVINDQGLGNVDLTSAGTATGFRLEIGADLAGGQAIVRVFTDDGSAGTTGRSSSATLAIPATGGLPTALEYIPFSAFTPTGGGADFTRVGAIALEITGVANVNGTAELVGAIGPVVKIQDFSNFQRADLSLTKTVDNATPGLNGNVTFVVSVANAGPESATNVRVLDNLPTGLNFVSSTPSQGTYDQGTGVWSVGTIASGGTANLRIVATVATAGAKTNTAQISASDQPDPDSTPNNSVATEDDQASVVVTPASSDLSLTKSANTTTPNLNENVTFTIVVANGGPSVATNVSVRDQLPSGITFVSGTPTQGSFNGATGIWNVGTVNPSSNATLTLVGRVTTAGTITNTAQISAADQPDPDSTPNNNLVGEDDQASVTLTPPTADLSLTKTVDKPNANVGENVTFTITVSNAGPSNALGIIVASALPAGMTLVSSNPSQGTFAGGNWNVGSLGSSNTATLQIVARVDRTGAKTCTAQITAAGQFDPDSTPNNNIATEDDQASVTVTPPVIDLSIAKTVAAPRPNVGGNATFTISVSNAGPNAATGVVVTDFLPAGLSFVSATPGQGTFDGTTGRWTVGNLAANGTASLTLVARVDVPGDKINVVEVTAADQFDSDSTPNNASASEDDRVALNVGLASADLSLTKTVNNNTPNVGQNVTFTIALRNSGPDAASGISVRDVLPDGLAFVSSAATVGTYSSATGIWQVGNLASNGNAVLSIIATATSTGLKTNTAEVIAAEQLDPDSTPNNANASEDDQASVSLTPQQIDLSVSKTVDIPRPNRGDTVTFTVTVANAGPSTATGVSLVERLPVGLTLVSGTPSQGVFNATTGVWNVGSIASAGSANLRVTARVASGTNPTLSNSAEISAADQPDLDSTPNNNNVNEDDQASARIEIQSADLSLTKTVDQTTPNVGENVSFRITVSNVGPDNATAIQVRDRLPEGLTFVSANPSQGTYASATGIWQVGDVANGTSATLDLIGRVARSGTKTNIAEIIAANQFDPDSTVNNSAPTEDDQASVSITPLVADLSLTKTVDLARPNIGQNVTFTLTLSNSGPNAASGIAVTDLLPPGLAFVSASPGQGTYDATSGVWSVGGLVNGTNTTLRIVARPETLGAKTNTAEITGSDQFDPDSTPSNGVATEDDRSSVIVTPASANLSLKKTVSNALPNVGDQITFTITVTNAGPDTAPGVAVRDLLPTGVTLVSSTQSQGTYNVATGIWSVGTISNPGTATLQLTVRTDVAGDFSNTAEITASERFDPNSTPGNGVTTEDDIASVPFSPQQIDLSLGMVADNLRPNVGQNVTYTVTVNNAGPSVATGVRVTDLLPSGVLFSSAAPSQGSYQSSNGVWTVGTIPAGGSATLSIVARVRRTGNYTNVAQVSAANQVDVDSTPGNNAATEDDQVGVTIDPPRIDLSVVGTIDKDNPLLGDDVLIRFTVTNAGPDKATGVQLRGAIIDGLSLNFAAPSLGLYDPATGIWTLGDLDVGQSETIDFNVRITQPGIKQQSLEVFAADQGDLDSEPANGSIAEDDLDLVTVRLPRALSKRLLLTR